MTTEVHDRPIEIQSRFTKSDAALIIVGHGSTLNPDSSEPTHRHAAEIRRREIFAEVAVCFWKEEPSLREILRTIDSNEVFVVPNFISEGYFTQTVIPRELGVQSPVSRILGKTVHYCDPVGCHPRMTDVLLERARETAPGVDPRDISLIIVGHGTGLNENSARAAKDQVQRISALECYGEVLAAYMEEPPLISDWHKLSSRDNVLVVPFFIADGLHSYQDIPVLLGTEEEGQPAASQRDVFRDNPKHLHGKALYYASAIGTANLMADVILDQVRDAIARLAPA